MASYRPVVDAVSQVLLEDLVGAGSVTCASEWRHHVRRNTHGRACESRIDGLGELLCHRWLIQRRPHRTSVLRDCAHRRNERAHRTRSDQTLFAVSIALAVFGIAGVGYGATVVYRARRQTVYQPVWQDWLWHVILPCCVYAALALAAMLLRTSTRVALFVIAGTALGLLLIALHNAWDTLIYIVVAGPRVDG